MWSSPFLFRSYLLSSDQRRLFSHFSTAFAGPFSASRISTGSPASTVAFAGGAGAEVPNRNAVKARFIDIANQPYNEFSEYWKEQNRGGAEFLISLLDERGADTISSLDLNDEAVRAEYGDLIHENWISRNEWVKDPVYGNPAQACKYSELTPEEQQKDIDHLGVLQKWIQENLPESKAA